MEKFYQNKQSTGLVRDFIALKEDQYHTLINGVFDSVDDASFELTNEMSNLLSSKFEEGFRVINATYDIISNNTYFFLTNPTTGVGIFGYINNVQNIIEQDEELVTCNDCSTFYNFAEPLENVEQTELNTFVTVLTDACHIENEEPEKGFMFDITRPIRKTVIKTEKCGRVLYFTDGNLLRRIELDRIEQYKEVGNIVCSDDELTPTCLDADKLLIFKKYNHPIVKPLSISVGGNLLEGVYQFAIAYSDIEGNTISEYTSITNPVEIFDRNKINRQGGDEVKPTNFAIQLKLSNLDSRFEYVKLVAVQKTILSKTNQAFVIGVFPRTTEQVTFSTTLGKVEIAISDLLQKNLFVKSANLITTVNNTLMLGDLTMQKELNLQPVVNLLGGFVKWQTHVATEDLYKDGVNVSKFLGYNRDEVVPLGIKFLMDGGFKTAVFPFIARPPKPEDLETVENADTESVLANKNSCNTTERTQRWQFYNDATNEGRIEEGEVSTVFVTEQETKVCRILAIAKSEEGSFVITDVDTFTTLEEYINDNRENPNAFGNSGLYDLLNPENYEENCLEGLFDEETCETPERVGAIIEVASIENQQIEGVERQFPTEYQRIRKPTPCSIYRRGEDNNFERDTQFEQDFMPPNRVVFFRDYFFTNESCATADVLQNITSPSDNTQPYFFNYIGANTILELLTSRTSLGGNWSEDTPSIYNFEANFGTRIARTALWFRAERNNRDSLILEVSQTTNPVGDDDITSGGANPKNPSQLVRLSLFTSCNQNAAVWAKIFNIRATAQQFLIKNITPTSFDIVDALGGTETITTTQELGNFTVALEPAFVPEDTTSGRRYRTAPADGCFSIVTRDVEFSELNVSWGEIIFNKRETYISTCTYQQPVINGCTALPYETGEFGYWESTEIYPNNKELFDSSELKIKPSDIDLDIESKYISNFTQMYADNLDEEGYFTLPKEKTDFTCKPIRHYRFPDNKIAPFIYDKTKAPMTDTLIYPLGVTIDENLINNFLNIAVNNGLISAEERSKINGYEIVRGDLTANRSVVSSGLLYDMRKYQDENPNTRAVGGDIYYSNYPFNDLGNDRMFYLNSQRRDFIPHPYGGLKNDKFTFHSPETDYIKPSIPTELSVQGYMFGNSLGFIDEVKEHPKWVILTSRARNLANLLATTETAAELAISLAQAGENYRFYAGLTNSFNIPGLLLSQVAAGLGLVSSALSRFGRFRYEWLTTFRNLGQPQNFAYYYYAEGKYGFLNNNVVDEGNSLRGIQKGSYISHGRFMTTNEVSGERFSVNHIQRESAVLLSLGQEHFLNYPETYRRWDNNIENRNGASMTFASDNDACAVGVSNEIRRNIASPYVALKNYIPNQHGNIYSIAWLSTGYIGDLQHPKNFTTVFGGDTFISRHTLKRKIPFFNATAFDQADMTPFNYKFYSNIGRHPRFFVDYEVLSDFRRRNVILPDIQYDFNFDCTTRRTNYYSPPSKFYLHYYGVPSFLTESRINTNNRIAGVSMKEDFFPNFSDLNELTQERNVSIREDNRFFYEPVYSDIKLTSPSRMLPTTFNREDNDCRNDKPNGVHWSLPDNSENNIVDPWVIFKPLDFFEFKSSYGRLKDIRNIENEQVLCRFENALAIYDRADITFDSGQNPEVRNLLTSFSRRPYIYSESDLGAAGTQGTQSISCQEGHFHVDAKRGQVIWVEQGGKSIQDIADTIDGKPSGMRSWFRQHLPFRMLFKFPNIDVDNPWNGVGIAMGYDARLKRIFITKKDYIAIEGKNIEYINGRFYDGEKEIFLTDAEYFRDLSFTIAFDLRWRAWIGWYDFKPNYYVGLPDYFQTGVNYSADSSEFGLWSHLLTNRSYQVFYGKRYPFVIDFQVASTFYNEIIKTISFKATTRRYHNEYDWASIQDRTFNKLWIYSDHAHSGELRLDFNDGSINRIAQYPITDPNGLYQRILVTRTDDIYNINYFYDRVLNKRANKPLIHWNANKINKSINHAAVGFTGKNILEVLRVSPASIRLIQDEESRFRYVFNLFVTKTNATK